MAGSCRRVAEEPAVHKGHRQVQAGGSKAAGTGLAEDGHQNPPAARGSPCLVTTIYDFTKRFIISRLEQDEGRMTSR